MTIATTILLGVIYPLLITGAGAGPVQGQGQRADSLSQRRSHRVAHHRAAFHIGQIFSLAPLGRGQRIRRRQLRRHQPRPHQSEADRPHSGRRENSARRKSGATDSSRSAHDFCFRPRSGNLSCGCGVSDSARRPRARHAGIRRCATWFRNTPPARSGTARGSAGQRAGTQPRSGRSGAKTLAIGAGRTSGSLPKARTIASESLSG